MAGAGKIQGQPFTGASFIGGEKRGNDRLKLDGIDHDVARVGSQVFSAESPPKKSLWNVLKNCFGFGWVVVKVKLHGEKEAHFYQINMRSLKRHCKAENKACELIKNGGIYYFQPTSKVEAKPEEKLPGGEKGTKTDQEDPQAKKGEKEPSNGEQAPSQKHVGQKTAQNLLPANGKPSELANPQGLAQSVSGKPGKNDGKPKKQETPDEKPAGSKLQKQSQNQQIQNQQIQEQQAQKLQPAGSQLQNQQTQLKGNGQSSPQKGGQGAGKQQTSVPLTHPKGLEQTAQKQQAAPSSVLEVAASGEPITQQEVEKIVDDFDLLLKDWQEDYSDFLQLPHTDRAEDAAKSCNAVKRFLKAQASGKKFMSQDGLREHLIMQLSRFPIPVDHTSDSGAVYDFFHYYKNEGFLTNRKQVQEDDGGLFQASGAEKAAPGANEPIATPLTESQEEGLIGSFNVCIMGWIAQESGTTDRTQWSSYYTDSKELAENFCENFIRSSAGQDENAVRRDLIQALVEHEEWTLREFGAFLTWNNPVAKNASSAEYFQALTARLHEDLAGVLESPQGNQGSAFLASDDELFSSPQEPVKPARVKSSAPAEPNATAAEREELKQSIAAVLKTWKESSHEDYKKMYATSTKFINDANGSKKAIFAAFLDYLDESNPKATYQAEVWVKFQQLKIKDLASLEAYLGKSSPTSAPVQAKAPAAPPVEVVAPVEELEAPDALNPLERAQLQRFLKYAYEGGLLKAFDFSSYLYESEELKQFYQESGAKPFASKKAVYEYFNNIGKLKQLGDPEVFPKVGATLLNRNDHYEQIVQINKLCRKMAENLKLWAESPSISDPLTQDKLGTFVDLMNKAIKHEVSRHDLEEEHMNKAFKLFNDTVEKLLNEPFDSYRSFVQALNSEFSILSASRQAQGSAEEKLHREVFTQMDRIVKYLNLVLEVKDKAKLLA